MINCKGEKMNKSELVDAIASGSGLTKADASRVLEAFMATVTDVLKKGDQVVIPGFGSFSTGNRSARTGRNPQTGKTIQIKASRVAKFKAGKNLKEAVQQA
ncbi:TPA: HU family DNA-binding protein [Legionella pneumophila]|nr:HU family DNA-binding protein [Legionella pneumophila]HAT7835906.1 HU family DNA-binding protein [Legionella pneumophila]